MAETLIDTHPASEVALGFPVAAARQVQPQWARVPLSDRLAVVRRFRHRLAETGLEIAATVATPQRRGTTETMTAEVLPLLDACRFLERTASGLLAPRRLGSRWRPLWLAGSQVELRREPFGVVLVIGPSNYPLLLPGVQAIQALAAGNAVVLKPGAGGETAARRLATELESAGLPPGVLQVLGEEKTAATAAIDAGVDKVVLTGAAGTGRAVLEQLAPRVTPAVMELSGSDPVLVLEDADLDLVTSALSFGLSLNSSFTCIAPRRVYVHRDLRESLEERLIGIARGIPARPLPPGADENLTDLIDRALAGGARFIVGEKPLSGSMAPLVLADPPRGSEILAADIAAPVLSLVTVASTDEAIELAADCPYRLGAAIFGNADKARALAGHLPAGVVVINDLIVPTADPRVPFGGRGESGFGVTRGAEGLLEMTVLKAVIHRRGRFRPHFDPPRAGDDQLFAAYARIIHGRGLAGRLHSLTDLARRGLARGQSDQLGESKEEKE
ncbi:MAG: aldehyde dehydrogenase family protein [Acidobacteria bacterium]|nr:MAG: aldehyde dehydrogenase family protein [Acidobacteriota bacterium]